jgi:XXXCH domain-containing protein
MQFSEIKSSMQGLFAAMQAKIDLGELPSQIDMDEFVRLCRRMYDQAEEHWLSEAEDFLQLTDRLARAIKKGMLPEAAQLARSMDEAAAFCHRAFKD